MLRFGKTKVAKEEFQGAKAPVKIQDVNIDGIAISKLVETNKQTKNSKYWIRNLDEVIRHIVFMLPKMSAHVKTFKDKTEGKYKNDKLISLHIDDDKLL